MLLCKLVGQDAVVDDSGVRRKGIYAPNQREKR